MAADREIEAMAGFVSGTAQGQVIKLLMKALVSDPRTAPREPVDMTTKAPLRFKEFLDYAKTQIGADNVNQMAVVKSLERVHDRIVACLGPPGTGKTRTLGLTMLAAFECQLKCILVGPANISVDRAAAEVLQASIRHRAQNPLPKGSKQLTLLRLYTQGAEFKATTALRRKEKRDMTTANQVPDYAEPRSLETNEDIGQAWDNAISNYKKYSEELKEWRKTVKE